MKKFVILLFVCLATLCQAQQQQIRFNITAADPVTGKRIKYTNVDVRLQYGAPIEFIGAIGFFETNDNPAAPSGSTANAKRAVESYMESFSTTGKYINTTTLVYVPSLFDSLGVAIPNTAELKDYLALKAINSFPGVAGSDAVWKLTEGMCKQMILVRKANGEFVN